LVATEALDRLQPTAASHDRVMILDAGHMVDPDGTLVRTARGLGICLGDSCS
jgi:hypothetical protein